MAQDNPVEPQNAGETYVKQIRSLDNKQSVVFDREGRGYLVKSNKLKHTVAWQPVKSDLLEKPYGFEDEIAERMPTVERIQAHLLRLGITQKEDLDDPQKMRSFENVFPKLNA